MIDLHSPRIRPGTGAPSRSRRPHAGRALGLAAVLFGATLLGALGTDALAPKAHAQDGAEVTPPRDGDRSMGFEAATGPQRENVSGLALMVSAYGIVWAFTMLYLVRMGRLEARLAADVERLERALGPD